MIELHIDQNIIEYSRKLTENKNFGKRGKYDGSPRQQFIGVVSENVVRKYLGYKPMMLNGFDGGYDIEWNGYKVDIKSMERTVNPRPHYVNNFVDYQRNHKADAFMFCSVNNKTKNLWICGWITKKEFLQEAKLYKKGFIRNRDNGTSFKLDADNWEIENYKLHSINK
jgi:hypothetical protein